MWLYVCNYSVREVWRKLKSECQQGPRFFAITVWCRAILIFGRALGHLWSNSWPFEFQGFAMSGVFGSIGRSLQDASGLNREEEDLEEQTLMNKGWEFWAGQRKCTNLSTRFCQVQYSMEHHPCCCAQARVVQWTMTSGACFILSSKSLSWRQFDFQCGILAVWISIWYISICYTSLPVFLTHFHGLSCPFSRDHIVMSAPFSIASRSLEKVDERLWCTGHGNVTCNVNQSEESWKLNLTSCKRCKHHQKSHGNLKWVS